MQQFTTEDLLLFLYQETSTEQTALIKEALEHDWDLKEKYEVLKNSLHTLDRMMESPRPESIQAILNYAAMTAPIEHS